MDRPVLSYQTVPRRWSGRPYLIVQVAFLVVALLGGGALIVLMLVVTHEAAVSPVTVERWFPWLRLAGATFMLGLFGFCVAMVVRWVGWAWNKCFATKAGR